MYIFCLNIFRILELLDLLENIRKENQRRIIVSLIMYLCSLVNNIIIVTANILQYFASINEAYIFLSIFFNYCEDCNINGIKFFYSA